MMTDTDSIKQTPSSLERYLSTSSTYLYLAVSSWQYSRNKDTSIPSQLLFVVLFRVLCIVTLLYYAPEAVSVIASL